MEDYVRILTVDNEVKALLLEKILVARNIPFFLKSFHDTALDGLYQLQMGWGYIEAPQRFADEIREVYDDLSG